MFEFNNILMFLWYLVSFTDVAPATSGKSNVLFNVVRSIGDYRLTKYLTAPCKQGPFIYYLTRFIFNSRSL